MRMAPISAPVQYRSTTYRAADKWEEGLGTGLRDRAVMGDKKQPVALPTPDGGVKRLAQSSCALRDCVADRLDVAGRAPDDS
jgi:hypothetical protein